MNKIYIHSDDEKRGPYTVEQIADYYSRGEIFGTTLVSTDEGDIASPMQDTGLSAMMAEIDRPIELATTPPPLIPAQDPSKPTVPHVFAVEPKPFDDAPPHLSERDSRLFKESHWALEYDRLHGKNFWAVLSAISGGISILLVIVRFGTDNSDTASGVMDSLFWVVCITSCVSALLGIVKGILISNAAKKIGKRSSNGAFLCAMALVCALFILIVYPIASELETFYENRR